MSVCGCPSCSLSLQGMLPPDLPLISVSKGLEVSTGQMMSEIIPSALQRKQPAVFLSGPSFAREVMELCPTVVVVASKVLRMLTAACNCAAADDCRCLHNVLLSRRQLPACGMRAAYVHMTAG